MSNRKIIDVDKTIDLVNIKDLEIQALKTLLAKTMRENESLKQIIKDEMPEIENEDLEMF
jgi:hypothetical protein